MHLRQAGSLTCLRQVTSHRDINSLMVLDSQGRSGSTHTSALQRPCRAAQSVQDATAPEQAKLHNTDTMGLQTLNTTALQHRSLHCSQHTGAVQYACTNKPMWHGSWPHRHHNTIQPETMSLKVPLACQMHSRGSSLPANQGNCVQPTGWTVDLLVCWRLSSLGGLRICHRLLNSTR
jgi:hypothetical protein